MCMIFILLINASNQWINMLFQSSLTKLQFTIWNGLQLKQLFQHVVHMLKITSVSLHLITHYGWRTTEITGRTSESNREQGPCIYMLTALVSINTSQLDAVLPPGDIGQRLGTIWAVTLGVGVLQAGSEANIPRCTECHPPAPRLRSLCCKCQ